MLLIYESVECSIKRVVGRYITFLIFYSNWTHFLFQKRKSKKIQNTIEIFVDIIFQHYFLSIFTECLNENKFKSHILKPIFYLSLTQEEWFFTCYLSDLVECYSVYKVRSKYKLILHEWGWSSDMQWNDHCCLTGVSYIFNEMLENIENMKWTLVFHEFENIILQH